MAQGEDMGRRRAIEIAFVPLMLAIAAGGVALAAADPPKVMVVAIVIIAIGVSFVAERMAPYEPAWNRDRGDRRRDMVHAVVNEGTVIGSLLLVPTLVDRLALRAIWPSEWPFAAQVVVAVVIADLGITIAHWASHRIGWLWNLHEVHHSVQRMYGLNGLMKHPAHQLIELTAGVTPLVLAGVPKTVATALAVCVAIELLLQHSNVDYATGGLDRLMAWNRPHRYHHIAAAVDGDVNFGLFTNIWDRHLLHTAVSGDRRFGPEDLGIHGRADYPSTWSSQMVEPFRA